MNKLNGIILNISIIACLLHNCTSDSNELIRNIFEQVIVKDDLEEIIKDTPEKDLMDSPYYSIISYEENKKGKYTVKAEVDYFFFKSVKVKIRRKYRFYKAYKKWERYTNEYKHYFEYKYYY
jgi:hypothetical protein